MCLFEFDQVEGGETFMNHFKAGHESMKVWEPLVLAKLVSGANRYCCGCVWLQ
jgi:hypothetical protein